MSRITALAPNSAALSMEWFSTQLVYGENRSFCKALLKKRVLQTSSRNMPSSIRLIRLTAENKESQRRTNTSVIWTETFNGQLVIVR